MSSKRLCVLCSIENLEAVRTKTGSRGDLNVPCSASGAGEPTHMVCFMALPEEKMNEFLSKQDLTIMEYEEPLIFLTKWNLKIIR